MPSISRRNLLFTAGGAAAVLAAGGATLLPGTASATTAPARAAGPSWIDASVVVEWNRTLLKLVRTPLVQPATVHETRNFAILHIAIHRAVEATAGRHASPVAAAAQAGHDVLAALYPSQVAAVDTQLATELATVSNPRSREEGVEAGKRAAAHILARRANDGSAVTPIIPPPGMQPGEYRPTPPNFPKPVFTHWSKVTPFVLERASQFRPHPYPSLASREYADATNEVQLKGQDTATEANRSNDQTITAQFWPAPAQRYWYEITQNTVLARHSSIGTAARVFAQVTTTLADATIALYEAKYFYHIWRPITAILLADADGNPWTTGNPNWKPLAPTTPADPSYPGAHSVLSEAAATVLRHNYGPHQVLAVTSEADAGVIRHFTRFQDAAIEAGRSRLFAGIHTTLDHESGLRLGGDVARFVLFEGHRAGI